MRPVERRFCRILILSAISIPGYGAPALAGGGYSDPGFVQQSQAGFVANSSSKGSSVSTESVTISLSNDDVSLTSTTTGVGAGGHSASSVALWDTTTVKTTVPGNVAVDSSSFSLTFAKGGGSLSLGESTTEVTVVINGKTYVMAKELAIAFARGTPYGGSSWVEVDGTLSMPASSSSSAPVANSKPNGPR